MAKMRLPQDFKDFLSLLNSHSVDYQLIGGYAVGYHGYPRATGDLDVWIGLNPENTVRLIRALQEFGLDLPDSQKEIFLQENKVFRMGKPPIRIELLTTISGVRFEDSYPNRVCAEIDGVSVNLISLKHLIENKKASGRPKDIDDLQHIMSP